MKSLLIFLCTVVLFAGTAGAKGPRKVHPNYDMIDLGGNEKSPLGVGGLRFLPDGRLVVVEWGGTNSYSPVAKTLGKVHLLTGVMEAEDADDVTWNTIKTNLKEPLGVEVLDGVIYIHQKGERGTEIITLTDQGNDDWQAEQFAVGWADREGYFWHSWPAGIVYQDGYFHINISSGLANSYERDFDGKQEYWPPRERGCWIRVDATSGDWEIMATGMRTNEDTWIGPWGGIWSDDNQGDWMPSNRHYYLKEGRHYGHYYGNQKEVEGVPTPMSPPAIYCTHDWACESPVGGWTLNKGIYAGQMLVCEHDYWGINRDFVERINGEIQGAVFDFGNALREDPVSNGHPHRVITAPPPNNDVIIFGCAGDNTGWVAGPIMGSLVKLVPNGTITYEMLAIRSMGPTSFEIEFTQPVNVSQATDPDNYHVETWTENPVVNYGGGAKVDRERIDPVSASMVEGSDNKKVLLTFRNGDLRTGNIEVSGGDITGVGHTVGFHLGGTSFGDAFGGSRVKSASGDDLWDNTAFYTLNQFGPGEDPPENPLGVEIAAKAPPGYGMKTGMISITAGGRHTLEVVNIKGEPVYSQSGTGPRDYHMHGLESGIYIVKVGLGEEVYSGRLSILH